MKRSATTLPLFTSEAPRWLFQRMVRLSAPFALRRNGLATARKQNHGIVYSIMSEKSDFPSTAAHKFTMLMDRIREALKGPLPGLIAQKRMSPNERDLACAPKDHQPKRAGVLVLLYPGQQKDQLYLVLTRRTETLLDHKGQISLPGGSHEPDDPSLAHTALREACEEVGVCSEDIRILGGLTPVYIPPSDFCVHPYVACVSHVPAFLAQPDEVAELLQLPLHRLMDDTNVRTERWMVRGKKTEVPYFDVFGHKVWGATAVILSELVEVLRAAGLPEKN
jgi:8-oxo-dGTP pyrophosphatase MutT (NUDIX family)